MALAAKSKKTSSQSNVDWAYVNSQLEEDSYYARIAALVDLGLHHQGFKVSDKGITVVSTKDEAFDIIEKAEDIVGLPKLEENKWDKFEEVDHPVFKMDFKIVKDQWVFPSKDGIENVTYADSEEEAEELLAQAKKLDKYKNLAKAGVDGYEEITTPFKLPFNIYDGGEDNELGIISDLTETSIKYSEDSDPVNYRVYLDPSYKEDIKGFAITPQFSSKSTVGKLCKATGNKKVMEDSDYLVDLLNSPYLQVLAASGESFFPSNDFGALRQKELDDVPALSIEGFEEGVVIDFDTVTVEQLEAIKLRKYYTDRIKKALNYEGSQMQKALEEYEASRGNTKPAEQVEEDVEADETPKTEKKTTPKKAAPKAEPEVDADDECPFDLDD